MPLSFHSAVLLLDKSNIDLNNFFMIFDFVAWYSIQYHIIATYCTVEVKHTDSLHNILCNLFLQAERRRRMF